MNTIQIHKAKIRDRKKELSRKIRLDFYPYTYVRTTVMRTLLFDRQDYDKMLKMDLNAIAEYLQDTTYKQEIDKYATALKGAELIEKSINSNLAASFGKLRRISSEKMRIVIEEYLKRKDIEDIKTILRGKSTKADSAYILNSIVGAGTLSYDYYTELLKKDSAEEIFTALSNSDFFQAEDVLRSFKKGMPIADIENLLDSAYYESMLQLSKVLTKQGKLFRDFLIAEIKVKNILSVLRLKRANISANEIEKYLFKTGDKAFDSLVKELVKTEKIGHAEKIFSKTELKNEIFSGVEAYKKTGSLIEIETNLYRHLLNKSLRFAHQNPLSIDIILGYMFAKDIEVRNLRMMVRGKRLGVSNDFLEKQMVS